MHVRVFLLLAGGLTVAGIVPSHAARAQQPSTPPAASHPFDTTLVMGDTIKIDSSMISDGRAIFHGRGTCYVCHGPKLEGGPVAPPLHKQGTWRDARNGEFVEIYRIVRHGVPGTVMISHPGGISDSLAVRVAAYIWAINHRGAKP